MVIAPSTLWTIGHSTRSIDDFLSVVNAYGIEVVADVRRFPGSRRLPQFSGDALSTSLRAAGIEYMWLPELGGRRRPTSGSEHLAWRHSAFRAYAEHAWSEEFAVGLEELLSVAEGLRTVIMCAEVLWWRCHRRIIADVLVSIGYRVIHIRDASVSEPHRITEPARLVRGRLTYERDR